MNIDELILKEDFKDITDIEKLLNMPECPFDGFTCPDFVSKLPIYDLRHDFICYECIEQYLEKKRHNYSLNLCFANRNL